MYARFRYTTHTHLLGALGETLYPLLWCRERPVRCVMNRRNHPCSISVLP